MTTTLAAFRTRHRGHVRGSTTPALTFFVPGDPKTQGNHSNSRTGHIYETTVGLGPWRKIIMDTAAEVARTSGRVFDGPCVLQLAFLIRTPRVVNFPYPTRQRDGDWDKLARPIGDALKDAGLLTDDKLVVDGAVTKRWGPQPGVTITLEEMPS